MTLQVHTAHLQNYRTGRPQWQFLLCHREWRGCETCHAGGLIHQKDEELRRDLSELLTLLVFDEMAAVQEWYSALLLVVMFHVEDTDI